MLTFKACEAIAGTAHGSSVEGYEVAGFARRWYADKAAYVARALARYAKMGEYTPELAAKGWKGHADRCELAYSAPALAPDMPGFTPAVKHNIDADGRRMAALYLERHYRRAVFALAGVDMPADLLPTCDDEG